MSLPQSAIHICNVPLTNAYTHTLYFADQSAQYAYFDAQIIKSFTDYTFVRKSWSVKVRATLEQARPWSYLYTLNSATGQRNFYFITDAEYINDATVELFLELDVMQTYMFNTSLTECFVEREHAATDTAGDNTIEESLELGELVNTDSANVALGDLVIMVLSTLDLTRVTEETSVPAPSGRRDNVFSGLGVYIVNPNKEGAFKTLLNQLSEWGKSDCIFAMWMYPKNLVSVTDSAGWNSESTVLSCGPARQHDVQITRPSGMGDESHPYVPRNQKLFTYPYCFLYASNNMGESAVFRYEHFSAATPACRYLGTVAPDASVRLFPIRYKGTLLNYEEGLTLGNFPSCSWAEDSYKLWLAQTQNARRADMRSANLSAAGGLVTAAVSAATGNLMGAGGGLLTAYHGFNQASSLLAAREDKSIQPPQAKGSYSPTVNVKAEFQTFTMHKKSVTAERAAIIDDYFDMYGYSTLRLKVPNKNHRPHWWYTKTAGCHVVGSAPAADKSKIAAIYDKGITFWRKGSEVGNYALDNRV